MLGLFLVDAREDLTRFVPEISCDESGYETPRWHSFSVNLKGCLVTETSIIQWQRNVLVKNPLVRPLEIHSSRWFWSASVENWGSSELNEAQLLVQGPQNGTDIGRVAWYVTEIPCGVGVECQMPKKNRKDEYPNFSEHLKTLKSVENSQRYKQMTITGKYSQNTIIIFGQNLIQNRSETR